MEIATAQNRIESSREKKDHFEKENAAFFFQVQNAYLELQKNNPNRIKKINSNADLKSVEKNVELHILNLIQGEIK